MGVRVEQLAGDAKLSVDTIRYYQKIGILHPPAREGRVAVYDDSHSDRLHEIRQLSDNGFSLAQIQRLADSSPHPLLTSLNGASDSLSLNELVIASGIDKEIVHLAVDAGLIRPLNTNGEQFGVATLSMLKAGVGLLDAGVPFDDLIHLAVRHADHVESVAKDAVALFAKHLDATSTSSQTQVVESIVPLVTELVAQHFRQTLVEQVGRHLLTDSEPE
jgi:DNA-binding transcriptional MerR regulator